MRYYVAGPMRGYPLENFPMFDQARDDLLDMGHEVLSPADNDREMGFDPTSDPPTRPEVFPLDTVIAWDLNAILDSETTGIVLLPGWEKSQGALVEKSVCEWVGKEILYYDPRDGTVAPALKTLAIGLCGYGGVGKDEVGRFLIEDHHFVRVAKGDLLKQYAMSVNPLIQVDTVTTTAGTSAVAGVRLLDLMTQAEPLWGQMGGPPWLPVQDEVKTQYPDLRLFLQNIADGLVNDVMGGRDIWNDRVWEIIKEEGLTRVVMTRISLPQEAEELKSRGGYIWRVERPGYGPANSHPNEVALDDWDWDLVIKNDGDLDTLRREVREAIWEQQ